ncbi:MAG: SPOR domain-containing protein, partial [Hyphomicrobiaceae bacterium]|nr:SPOR domain-containing protein [Hyphomicrobiaceae bacterium]
PVEPVEEMPSVMDDMPSFMTEPATQDDARFQPGHENFDAGVPHQPEVIDQAAINAAAFDTSAIEPASVEPVPVEPAPIGAAPVDPVAHVAAGETAAPGALQTFEATYDQHPEIPLGAFEQPGEPQPDDQPFMEPQPQHPAQPQHVAGDADFLGGEIQAEEAPSKGGRGRKVLMAASGLVGVLALGGALAFAYKIGGDSDIAKAGKPPLIQADSRPVKVAPDKPGGKEFPHKNKKIYERLGGKESEEVVKIKPRQEDIAAAATAAVGTPGAAQPAQPSAATPGAPRKVKTLTVRPDGTIEAAKPQAPAGTPPGVVTASDGTVTMAFPSPAATPPAQAQVPGVAAPVPAAAPPQAQPVAPAVPQPAAQPATAAATPAPAPQQQQAAVSPAAIAPPVQKPQVPSATRQAAAQPAAAASGSYVVQVAARKSQTDALAAFADIQQKYPRLLNGYRPIIKRADLGNKGVWYRLNVGPVESKKVASSLCGQLKSAGMRSCIVRSQ